MHNCRDVCAIAGDRRLHMHTESRSLIKSRTQSVNVDSLRKKMKTIPGKIWLSVFFLFTFSLALTAQQLQLVVQKGHADGVKSVTFSPDGKTLASGSSDQTIKIWDLASGRELRTLVGPSSNVTSVAFSPDGKILASGSWDQTIKLWDPISGQELPTLSGHSHAVAAVAFNVDGSIVASGSWDHTIKLWDVSSGQGTANAIGPFSITDDHIKALFVEKVVNAISTEAQSLVQ